jgi:hypothetical protein
MYFKNLEKRDKLIDSQINNYTQILIKIDRFFVKYHQIFISSAILQLKIVVKLYKTIEEMTKSAMGKS